MFFVVAKYSPPPKLPFSQKAPQADNGAAEEALVCGLVHEVVEDGGTAAVDLFQPLFKNDAEAVAKRRLRPAERKITEPGLFVSRCAAHADELYSLMAKGQLTAKNIVKIYQDGTPPPKRPYVTVVTDVKISQIINP